MSKMNWLLVIAIILLVVMAKTKPAEGAHRKVIAERTPVRRAVFGVQKLVGGRGLKYHDFFFVSVMTVQLEKNGPEIPMSLRRFGKVYYGKSPDAAS